VVRAFQMRKTTSKSVWLAFLRRDRRPDGRLHDVDYRGPAIERRALPRARTAAAEIRGSDNKNKPRRY